MSARIRYLEFNNKFPVSLEYLGHLVSLLSHCSIDKIKLFVDTIGLFYIHKISSSFTGLRSVEYILDNSMTYDMLAPFM
ncbi:hypothetical protein PMAYCL1PPCAC_10338, partial [Pristionchus mayeri]